LQPALCIRVMRGMTEAKRIVDEVFLLAEGLLSDYGMEVVDVDLRFEGGRRVLRVFIDKEGGVTLADCARISRELGDLIEAEDMIDGHYVLEISSPGLNRPLKKERDFVRSIGKMVKLRMVRPINNRRNFIGRLQNVNQGTISLLVDQDNLVELPLKEVDKARLEYEFHQR
jgi:ribosome maturation factor RimP